MTAEAIVLLNSFQAVVLVKKKITMAGPITKEYMSATSKSFISNNNNGKMIEKNFIEIEGTFLLKICDNAFYGNDGEDVFKHINSFLEVVEPLKIRGLSHDRFRLSVFPTSLSGAAKEWFTNECIGTISTWDDLVEKFVLKFYNLCEHAEERKTVDDNDLDTNWPHHVVDIDGFCNGGELPEMVQIRSMSYFQDHKWYDELMDGKLKDETLTLITKVKKSWGDATPGVMKFCIWLKNSFENFHELDHNVLVKLQECWWKVNTHKNRPNYPDERLRARAMCKYEN
ncbi:hypothetical protein Tco_0550806 [Tanacetum coccineum]